MENNRGMTEETPSRREREKAAHRREIMEAAVRVFARRGFAAATLDEIAQEAEFSKGAIYLYFTNKDDLLSTILLDLMQNTVIGGIKGILTGERRFREELTELLHGAAEFSFSHHLHMSVSMSLHLSQFSGLSEETRTKMMECHTEMINVLFHRCEQAKSNGELRDVNIHAAVGLIHGTLDCMVMTRWGIETVEELTKAADEVIEIIFGGIEKKKKE